MISEVSTALQMRPHNSVDRLPREHSGSANIFLAQCFEQQGTQNSPQPLVRRDVEAFFLARENRLRQFVPHQLAQEKLQLPAADLHILRQGGREFDDTM